jgi:hypothetical protein
MSWTGEMMGPTLSTTVTVKVSLVSWPRGSEAVQVTVVTPIRNVEFGGGQQTTLVPAWPSSIAVGSM